MKIGFIGFGEASYCISKGIREQNAVDIYAYDSLCSSSEQGRVVKTRAEECGVELLNCASEVAVQADVLFASVPSSKTLDVCEEVAGSLRSGRIYADVSASTPATKEQIWSTLKSGGVLFVDAAMLGSLPQDLHRVPITASGNGAKAFYDLMTPLGMRITLAGERPGAASAIKLVRSIFMKGLAACFYEMLLAADAYGVCDEVITSAAESLDGIPFVEHLNRLVTGTSIHAARRAAELKGSAAMLEECGLDSSMTEAAILKHELIGKFGFAERYAGRKPSDWREVIQLMQSCRALEGKACP